MKYFSHTSQRGYQIIRLHDRSLLCCGAANTRIQAVAQPTIVVEPDIPDNNMFGNSLTYDDGLKPACFCFLCIMLIKLMQRHLLLLEVVLSSVVCKALDGSSVGFRKKTRFRVSAVCNTNCSYEKPFARLAAHFKQAFDNVIFT